MLNQLEEMPQKIILCTIYRPNFDNKDQQEMCQTGLILFNEIIIRQSIQVEHRSKEFSMNSSRCFSLLARITFDRFHHPIQF